MHTWHWQFNSIRSDWDGIRLYTEEWTGGCEIVRQNRQDIESLLHTCPWLILHDQELKSSFGISSQETTLSWCRLLYTHFTENILLRTATCWSERAKVKSYMSLTIYCHPNFTWLCPINHDPRRREKMPSFYGLLQCCNDWKCTLGNWKDILHNTDTRFFWGQLLWDTWCTLLCCLRCTFC